MDNFNIKKFLTENRLTSVSRLLENIEDPKFIKTAFSGIANKKIAFKKSNQDFTNDFKEDDGLGHIAYIGSYDVNFKVGEDLYTFRLDNVQADVPMSGKYYPATRMEPAEYPEPDFSKLEWYPDSIDIYIAKRIDDDFQSIPDSVYDDLGIEEIQKFIDVTGPNIEA
jgi:hypothetical protein